MLVYTKKIMFIVTPNTPMYNGILHKNMKIKLIKQICKQKETPQFTAKHIYVQKQVKNTRLYSNS